MCKYLAFYGGKRIEIESDTSYHAQLKAAEELNVPVKRQYLIRIMLCIRADGTEVLHTPDL